MGQEGARRCGQPSARFPSCLFPLGAPRVGTPAMPQTVPRLPTGPGSPTLKEGSGWPEVRIFH